MTTRYKPLVTRAAYYRRYRKHRHARKAAR